MMLKIYYLPYNHTVCLLGLQNAKRLGDIGPFPRSPEVDGGVSGVPQDLCRLRSTLLPLPTPTSQKRTGDRSLHGFHGPVKASHAGMLTS